MKFVACNWNPYEKNKQNAKPASPDPDVLQPKSSDPSRSTGADPDVPQPKTGDPGRSTAAEPDVLQPKASLVAVVGCCWLLAVVVATRESRLCRQKCDTLANVGPSTNWWTSRGFASGACVHVAKFRE